MLNKILSIVIVGNLILAPVAIADDSAPRFTQLEEGAPAPFAGTLFNPQATAQLIAESQFEMSECDLRIEFEVGKTQAECQLQLSILQASYDSLNQRHTELMTIKNDEIETYRAMALEQPNKNNHWWMAGGVVAGIGLTLGVLFATQEIRE
jgi:ElaB/YqjD/DUF883 family membrane-anchored ribosome-binding protein